MPKNVNQFHRLPQFAGDGDCLCHRRYPFQTAVLVLPGYTRHRLHPVTSSPIAAAAARRKGGGHPAVAATVQPSRHHRGCLPRGNRRCSLLTNGVRDTAAAPHQKLPPPFVNSHRSSSPALNGPDFKRNSAEPNPNSPETNPQDKFSTPTYVLFRIFN